MAFELQIRASILAVIASQGTQARLRITCFDPVDTPFGRIYIDHTDVADVSQIQFVATGSAVRLSVPVNIYTVARHALLLSPGAAADVTLAGQVYVIFEIAVTDLRIGLNCVDINLGAFATLIGADAAVAKATLVKATASAVTIDLSGAIASIGLSVPTNSRVDLVDDIVAVRFDPAGIPTSHLPASLQWGIFLDGKLVEQLTAARVPSGNDLQVTSMMSQVHWRPANTVPHVDVNFQGHAILPDPWSGDVSGIVGCDFSVTSTYLKFLRATVHWSISIDLGALVPAVVEHAFEDDIEFDPTALGGIPIGPRAYVVDMPLPAIAFNGTQFNYVLAAASDAGMTIGGTVSLPPDPGKGTLQISSEPFGSPYQIYHCSNRETFKKKGVVLPEDVVTRANIWLSDAGSFCAIEIISPGQWIFPYFTTPPSGESAEAYEIDAVISCAVASGITGSVLLIVRTPRGVRAINLGVPPPLQLDVEGHVSNALMLYIPDCLYFTEHQLRPQGINWGRYDHDQLTNPESRFTKSWSEYIREGQGLNVKLVNLFGLEPGELLQFRSTHHSVDVVADQDGNATVPAMLIASDWERATLVRVNRRSIAGHFKVRSALFQRRGVASTTEELGFIGNNNVSSNEAQARSFDPTARDDIAVKKNEGVIETRRGFEYAKDGQIKSKALAVESATLPGIVSLHPLPGFGQEDVTIATMADGSMLVLETRRNTNSRVAGTFLGPIGAMHALHGEWWSSGFYGNRATVFLLRNLDSEIKSS